MRGYLLLFSLLLLFLSFSLACDYSATNLGFARLGALPLSGACSKQAEKRMLTAEKRCLTCSFGLLARTVFLLLPSFFRPSECLYSRARKLAPLCRRRRWISECAGRLLLLARNATRSLTFFVGLHFFILSFFLLA